MKKSLFTLIILFFSIIGQTGAESLSGLIRNNQTGEPVAEAVVRLTASKLSALSDRQGQFFIIGQIMLPDSATVQHIAFETKSVVITGWNPGSIYLNPKIFEAEPVVVSAARLPMLAGDVAASLSVISAKDFAGKISSSLADAISRIGGISRRSYGAAGAVHTLSIRGGPAHNTLVLLDGIRISSDQNGLFDGGSLPLSIMRQIEVYKSGNSAIYGADAVSGVINISTLSPNDRKNRSFEIGAGIGSFGLTRLFADLRQPLPGFGKVSLLVSDERADGDFPFEYNGQERKRWNADYQRQNGLLSYIGQPQTNLTLQIQTLWQNSEVGVPGQVRPSVPGTASRGPGQSDENVFAKIGLSGQIKSRLRLETTVFQHWQNQHYSDPGIDIDSRHKLTAGGLRFDCRFKTDSVHSLNSGYEYRRSHINSTDVKTTTRRQHSIFFLDLIRLPFFSGSSNLSLQPALRFDHYSDFGWQISPKAGLLMRIERNMRVDWFANLGKNFRAPGFNDMYWQGDGSRGNPDLRPEKSINFETGLRLKKQYSRFNWEIGTTVFINRIKDQIMWQPETGNTWRPKNVDRVRTRGWENEVELTFFEELIVFDFNYTRTQSRQYAPGKAYQNKQLIYIPAEVVNASLGGQWKHWLVGVSGHYESHRYVTMDNFVSLPSFLTFNANLSCQFTIGRQKITVKSELLNLSDTRYESVMNYPLPGREYRIETTLRF